MVFGTRTKCMGEGNIFGKMENAMMASTSMIKRLVLVYFIGLMGNAIKAIGRMGDNMEKES